MRGTAAGRAYRVAAVLGAFSEGVAGFPGSARQPNTARWSTSIKDPIKCLVLLSCIVFVFYEPNLKAKFSRPIIS